MQTKYAYGRTALPAPIVTTESGGSISGNSDTYYFWVKARNRVGYNTQSAATSLVIANARKVRISAATFSTFDYEGWRHVVVSVSKTNDFNTSRIIYKQELFTANQASKITPVDVVFSTNYSLNGDGGSVQVENIASFPTTELMNGFRVYVQSTERVYEYVSGSNLPADNISIVPAVGGQWVAVSSNSLRESSVNADKELFQVNDTELMEAPLPSVFQSPVAIKYYIVNNDLVPLTTAELDLNAYISDKSLQASYYTKVLGYLNLTTFALDTTNVNYVNTVVEYPNTKVTLTKALPAGSALVVEVTPNIVLDSTIVEGTYVTLYPKLNAYTVTEGVADYGEPVADLATLKALPSSAYKDRQTRFVESKRNFYAFDSDSVLADNGNTVIVPVGNPASGRWLINSSDVLPGTITPSMLSTSTLDLITGGIETTTSTINASTTFTIDLDTTSLDYFIITSPNDDGGTTLINIIGTLANNTTKAIMLELRQRTGIVAFHNSIVFPGGNIPVLSGNAKTDLFVITLVKDGAGTLKKRAFMAQKDIG